MPTYKDVHMQNYKITDYGLVSIIMPNYNSEKYLQATIQSLIRLSYIVF